jgi:hypothetical protein
MKDRRNGFSVIGVGAAACVACCAAPIAAFLGGLSIAGLAGGALFGVLGVVVVLAVGTGWWLMRSQRRRPGPFSTPEPVFAEAPASRPR